MYLAEINTHKNMSAKLSDVALLLAHGLSRPAYTFECLKNLSLRHDLKFYKIVDMIN